MKSRLHGVEMKEEDYVRDEKETKKSKEDEKTFRSYDVSWLFLGSTQFMTLGIYGEIVPASGQETG